MDTNIKGGFRTTEFWTTMFLHLLSAITVILTLTGHSFDSEKLQPLVPMAAMLASGLAQAYYSHSRSSLKAVALTTTPVATTVVNNIPPVG